MAEVVPPTLSSPPDAPVPRHRLASDVVLHWRGLLAFSLLGALGVMGPDITPSVYFDIYHYIPRYVLLALSIGFGLSAVRSGHRLGRHSSLYSIVQITLYSLSQFAVSK